MTGLGTSIASLVAAAAVAAGGVVAGGGASGSAAAGNAGAALAGGAASVGARTALVIDASLARDGRDLIDPRLRELDGELRIARTTAEAETDLRYFAAQGYRLVVAGPDSREAADATGLAVSVRPL
jgi:hypothetical protein